MHVARVTAVWIAAFLCQTATVLTAGDRVDISCDGKRMATAGYGVIIWDIPRATLLHKIEHVYGPVCFSPDGKLLAAHPGGAKSVSLWDVATAEFVRKTEEGAGYVNALDWSPDGNRIVAVLAKGKVSQVVCWKAATGKQISALDTDDSLSPISACFHRDSRHVLLACKKTAALWEYVDGRLSREISVSGDPQLEMPLIMGAYWTDRRGAKEPGFTIDLDEFMLFKRALSEEEIRSLCSQGDASAN